MRRTWKYVPPSYYRVTVRKGPPSEVKVTEID